MGQDESRQKELVETVTRQRRVVDEEFEVAREGEEPMTSLTTDNKLSMVATSV